MQRCLTLLAALMTLLLVACQSGKPPVITGELKKWHTITLTFTGPHANEEGGANPFLDYRFDVTFRKGQHAFTVPGYFAADGNAANTSAADGNKWRVHFSPDEEGEWSWYATFRKGEDAALSYEPESIPKAGYFDAMQGKLVVGPTDKSGRDFRGRGRLEYYSRRYWRFAESGDYFIKIGVSADNLFATADFDGDFTGDDRNDDLVRGWEAHVQDWHPGDPVWQDEKGKGGIGAINYLARQGINGISLLTMNIEGRDQNVFPFTRYNERLRYDVSRLDQWEIVLEHANRMGVLVQLRTQEGVNQSLLDGGSLDRERQLYYRMLIARFSHYPALIWDLGESGGGSALSTTSPASPQTPDQRLDMAQYFYEHDPYLHPLLFQNSGEFSELLTTGSKYTAALLRLPVRNTHEHLLHYHGLVEKRGLIWTVTALAPFTRSVSTAGPAAAMEIEELRMNALWGGLMAGGAGVELARITADGRSDLTMRDWRQDEYLWSLGSSALAFFRRLPVAEMESRDDLVVSRNAWCLCKPGEVYALYLPKGGMVQLDLKEADRLLELQWFDPRTGEYVGESTDIRGGGRVQVGPPPGEAGLDWALVLRQPGS